MKIDCISDLHGEFPELSGGDLLVIAGDLTARDSRNCWTKFYYWIMKQSYKKIIFIAGNHDNAIINLNPGTTPKSKVDLEYLCDSGTEFEGLKIWGSPWTRQFYGMNPHAMAFTCETEDQLSDKWNLIPHDADILVTHTPPYGILDGINDISSIGKHVGSTSLGGYLKYAFRPYLHVFGHIHEGYGIEERFACRNGKMMKSVNACIMNENYQPVNKPVRIEL